MKKNNSRTFESFTRFRQSIKLHRIYRNAATIAVIFFVIITTACLPGRVSAGEEKVVPVVPATVRLEAPLEEIPLPGSAFPWKESSLSTQVDGLVLEVRVDDGDRIRKGETLIRLDNILANLEALEAKAAFDQARLAYDEALRQQNEAAKLVKKRHIAQTTYQALIAETKIKHAAREKLDAEFRRASELAGRYRIVAPFDGVVGTVSVELGQWVESGDAVIKLFQIDILKIRVSVPQRFYSAIDPGTPVAIFFDALQGPAIEASVSRKIPIGNPDARTFPVRIDLPNPDYRVAPGMSAKVVFRVEDPEGKKVPTVPRDALLTAPDGSESVWKIDRDGDGFSVRPIAVKSGRFFRKSVEITKGAIAPGDFVVVRGNEILRSGQKVQLPDTSVE